MELAVECNSLFHLLPEWERFSLGDEILRAGVAIPTNIAASHDCPARKEALRCLDIARAKLRRLETLIGIAKLAGYLDGEPESRALILMNELQGLLDLLIAERSGRSWD